MESAYSEMTIQNAEAGGIATKAPRFRVQGSSCGQASGGARLERLMPASSATDSGGCMRGNGSGAHHIAPRVRQRGKDKTSRATTAYKQRGQQVSGGTVDGSAARASSRSSGPGE